MSIVPGQSFGSWLTITHCLWGLCPPPGELGTKHSGSFVKSQKRLVRKQDPDAAPEGEESSAVTITGAGVRAELYY